MMSKKTQPKRRRRWPLIVVGILVIVLVGGWFWLNSFIRSELANQLADAGIDSPQVGSVVTGLGGFTASDIQFESNGSSIKIDSLEIHQPIWVLAQGTSAKDEIRVSGGNVSIDAKSFGGPSTFSLSDLDLSIIDTVANRIIVEHVSVNVFGDDGAIELDLAQLSLENDQENLQLSGTVNFIDGELTVDGNANKNSGNIDLEFAGNQFRLVDQHWHQWPIIGPAVKKHIQADAVFDLNGRVAGSLKQGLSYQTDITTKNARMFFPKFQLPVAIRSADVTIDDGLITYKKVHAALGEHDEVHATGSTTIGRLPSVSRFEADFSEVDVADLRKLVDKIPDAVSGSATGTASGSVSVNQALETTLKLAASGDTNMGSYGLIEASKGFVDVGIEALTISPKGKTLDLQGEVLVKASAKQQDADDVLKTFHLETLDQQFEFEAVADGEVDLRIPLASAGDLRTWTLIIAAATDEGIVSGIKLRDLKVNAYLQNGLLMFDPTKARLAERPESEVTVKVAWPLPNAAVESIAQTGSVEVSGNQVPPKIGLAFFDRQMANAKINYAAKPQVAGLLKSEIDGGIAFFASIRLPSGPKRPVEQWVVDASLYDSALTLGKESLDQIESAISIRNGVLSVDRLQGSISNGGQIEGAGGFNLASGKIESVTMKTSKVPAAWVANAIIEGDSSGTFAERTGLNSDNVAEKLKGTFASEISIDPQDPNNFLWKASSKAITVFGSPFTDLSAAGHYDGHLDIENVVTLLPGGGAARLEGDWIADVDQGNFQLQWNDAAVVPLLKSQFVLPESFGAKSDGNLKFTLIDSQPVFTGVVDLIEPSVFGGTFADHRLEVSTRDNRIQFRDVPNKDQKTVSFDGSISMSRPFDFTVKGSTNSMPLSTAMFDKLSGSAAADFEASGQASPWKVESTGEVKFTNLSFDNTLLSDIRSQWNFDTDKPKEQKLEFAGLGGEAILDTKESGIDALRFRTKNIDLSQLVLFQKLPVKLSGNVTGIATIKNWRDAATRTIRLAGESKSIHVGAAKLSNVEANALVTDGGKKIQYAFESQFLEGKLTGSGDKTLESLADAATTSYPLKMKLVNARLKQLAEAMSSPDNISKHLRGRVSVTVNWDLTPGEFPAGTGQVSVEDIKYRNRLASRNVSSPISLSKGVLAVKRIRAELKQGEITGKATIPLTANVRGSYELDVRNFSLSRLLYVLLEEPPKANGVVDARLHGRVGRTITGSGTLGLSQAGLFGSSSESMKIPIRYLANPAQQKVLIEIPSSRIKAFRGTVDGAAKIEIGSRIRIESKLELSNIDSQTLLRTLSGYKKPGTGKLSGKLDLSARNYRSAKDLAATFTGKLAQSNAFSFPLFTQLSVFLGNGASLQSDKFDSETIKLVLSKGRVEVSQFRLQSSLVSIFVSGDAWLSGKLDLEVSARVERLNQPTLIDQLAGSPIARLAGPQAAFIAQAANFLSERIIFIDVSGTAKRPQMRLQPGKQLKEEAIRYFLRGSQIFPNTTSRNN